MRIGFFPGQAAAIQKAIAQGEFRARKQATRRVVLAGLLGGPLLVAAGAWAGARWSSPKAAGPSPGTSPDAAGWPPSSPPSWLAALAHGPIADLEAQAMHVADAALWAAPSPVVHVALSRLALRAAGRGDHDVLRARLLRLADRPELAASLRAVLGDLRATSR